MYSSADLVMRLARPILKGHASSIEVRQDAERGWCEVIQYALRRTVLTGSCSNVNILNPMLHYLKENFTDASFSNFLTLRLDGIFSRILSAQRASGLNRDSRIWGIGTTAKKKQTLG